MADQATSLPVRTETSGDVKIVQVDATITSQGASIDANGSAKSRIADSSGNVVTSGAQGTQRALDVEINFGSAVIDPRSIRALTSSDVVTTNQGTKGSIANAWPVVGTDGTNSQAYLATGEAKVSITQPLPAGANNIGSVNQGTSPWITKDQSDGSASGGTAGSFSMLSGLIFNTALPTLTTGQQASLQGDSSARLIIAPLTNTSIVKAQLQDNSGVAITLGQKTMSASVPVTFASDQSKLGVNLNDATGNPFSTTNPLPVTITVDNAGTEINSYADSTAVAAGSSVNQDYTVSAGKTLLLTQIESSGSGKMKVEVQVETAAASGVFNSKFVQFNSTATPNCSLILKAPITVLTGVRVRVIKTNRDLLPQDLYATIVGQEV